MQNPKPTKTKRNNMKKYIATLFALALAIGSITFVGCGGGPEEDPNAVGAGGGETTSTNEPSQAELDALAKEKGYKKGSTTKE